MEQSTILTDADKKNLVTTAKWGKFLAILGFIFSAMIIFGGLAFVGGSMGAMGEVYPGLGGGIGFLYILMSLIYVFPSYYLLRFSTQIQDGILAGDQEDCTKAFNNLRKLFVFMGVMTIVVLGVYFLAIVFMIMGGMMGQML